MVAAGTADGSRPAVARPGRRTNVALLGLLLAAFATGVLAFGTGTTGASRLVAVAHGAFGLGLLLLVPWKSVIVRRGLRRRSRSGGRSGDPSSSRSRPDSGVALGVLVVVTVVTGLLHSVGGYHPVLGVTALTVHVGAAALSVPLLVAHSSGRRQRPRRADLSRRSVVRAGALTIGSLLAYGTLETATAGLGLPGRHRRETGSYEVGSGVPEEMPVTQWFTDTVPVVNRGSWQLTVGGQVLPLADLPGDRDTVRAVLDCTGGWYAEQEWRGVRLDRLVGDLAAGERSVDVISVTGYRRRFGVEDLDRLLLATEVGGEPLTDGHGGPVRLVAPGRRGFWWVKWVDHIEVTSEPGWLQSPFPLQ